jgi:hypothetical protein
VFNELLSDLILGQSGYDSYFRDDLVMDFLGLLNLIVKNQFPRSRHFVLYELYFLLTLLLHLLLNQLEEGISFINLHSLLLMLKWNFRQSLLFKYLLGLISFLELVPER